MLRLVNLLFFFFKQKTAYEMRISDWSSDVCSSDLEPRFPMRDVRMDWVLAAAAIVAAKLLNWELLALAHSPLPLPPIILGMVSTILFFPLVACLAAWMERQWLAAG